MGKVNKKPFVDKTMMGKKPDGDLAVALLKMIAVGVVGGAGLIAGGKKVGDKIKEK